MTDILSYLSSWSVLKWIVLVLFAAFIGQFGKMAANAIAAKIRTRRGVKETSLDAPKETSVSPASAPSLTGSMTDKKLLKAMAKSKKKEAKNN
jgi:hypothetical protein